MQDDRQIDPVAGRDGGEPCANIRQVPMFDPARVAFVDRPGATTDHDPEVARLAWPGGCSA